jgi:hypothetical protein
MQKIQQAREKSVKQEHKTAQALSNAQHKHDRALADVKKAANDISVCIVVLPASQATLTLNSRYQLLASCRWFVTPPHWQLCQRNIQEAHRTIENRRSELEQVQRKKDSGDVGFITL